jgi:hypothetical protein
LKCLATLNRVVAVCTVCRTKSEPQSELEWRPRAGVILCLKKKWTRLIVGIVIPGRERRERTRNLEIPGLRFAHPGMTAINHPAPINGNASSLSNK